MAHFAQLDENNIVTQVVVVHNDVIRNEPFPASEPIGIEFCQSLFGADTVWRQTSYNASFRYNYAAQGYLFDPTKGSDGAFIPPQPDPSWTLDEETYQWVEPAPVTGE